MQIATNRKTCRSASLREKHARESRQKRDEKALMQGVLLYLLNQHCSISFKRPKKMARLTHQVFSVKTLQFDNECLEISSFVRQRCQGEFKKDTDNGLDEKKAYRRYLGKKQVEMTNLLVDLCIEIGYFFDFKKTCKGRRGNTLDVIQNIYYEGKFMFGSNEFNKIGAYCSEHLNDVSKNVTKVCSIPKYNLDHCKPTTTVETSLLSCA
ncbi:TATA-binding protein-associated phosphoprotein [Entamoeba marina]